MYEYDALVLVSDTDGCDILTEHMTVKGRTMIQAVQNVVKYAHTIHGYKSKLIEIISVTNVSVHTIKLE